MIVCWVGVLLVLAGCDGRQPHYYQIVRNVNYEAFFIDNEADRWMCMIFGICIITPVLTQKPEFGIVYEWSQLEFDYANAQQRQTDIDDQTFLPGKPTPIDVDVHYSYATNKKNRVFITIPRFQPGVPVTLGIVTDRKLNNNPIISPYPSWDWHTNPKQCKQDRLISVFRIMVDECQRLWVLDTGRLLSDQICSPQILAFDLQTNKIVHSFQIPKTLYESPSILVTPVVDVRDAHASCKDTFVYVADVQAFSIIVYDVKNNRAWKAQDKTMYPYPNYGTYRIQGDSFDLMDGVLGMALSPYKPGEDRKLFYHAMSSPTENWVYTSDLRNETRFSHDPQSSPQIFHTFKGQRSTQSAAEAIDKNGIMYFGLMSDVTIDCWNTNTEYGGKNVDVIARNSQTLQFASGVKVVTNKKAAQELWVLTCRFQRVMAATLSTSEINFRIQAGRADDLVFGTTCKSRHPSRPGGGYGLLKPPGSGR